MSDVMTRPPEIDAESIVLVDLPTRRKPGPPYYEVFLQRAFPGSKPDDDLAIRAQDVGVQLFPHIPQQVINGADMLNISPVAEIELVGVRALADTSAQQRIIYQAAEVPMRQQSKWERYVQIGRTLLKGVTSRVL